MKFLDCKVNVCGVLGDIVIGFFKVVEVSFNFVDIFEFGLKIRVFFLVWGIFIYYLFNVIYFFFYLVSYYGGYFLV